MIKVRGVILSFFQLILGIPSKLALDAINKGLGVPQIFLKESFELWPRDQSGTFVAVLVLGLSEADGNVEESSGKSGTIYSCST